MQTDLHSQLMAEAGEMARSLESWVLCPCPCPWQFDRRGFGMMMKDVSLFSGDLFRVVVTQSRGLTQEPRIYREIRRGANLGSLTG